MCAVRESAPRLNDLLQPAGNLRRVRSGKVDPRELGNRPESFCNECATEQDVRPGPQDQSSRRQSKSRPGRPCGRRWGWSWGRWRPARPALGGGGGFNTSSNSDRRYNLTMGVGVRNLFNNVNVANPNAVLGSPIFDKPNSLQGGPFSQGGTANRRIELQATFSF